MISTPICIVGCGPIGLTGALLLAKHGVPTLLLERRSELNTHPRSRFVDTNTMELMRFLGIEKEVEHTGLGPDWTDCNRWSESLAGKEFAAIASPTFHTVPRATSPCLPVMTCQDYVEAELLKLVQESDLIDCRFNTEASNVSQSEEGVTLTIRDVISGAEDNVSADFLIGADGPHSSTRGVIGSELETDPLPTYSQDIIFEADLSDYVGDRKGGLLYCMTSEGVSVFQPLNGVRRWRCQLFKPFEEDLSEEQVLARLRLAIGADDVDIKITSIGHWQPTPGCVSKFSDRRIFLAGDAAHISVPTGGMGNNIGFLGIRNLAWKLALVVQGHADAEILKTYESELKPAALKRIAHGVDTTNGMRVLIGAIYAGDDLEAGKHATRKYADYDGIILGHEIVSDLVAPETSEPPRLENPVIDFVPAVRSGRRAPHIWVDEARKNSLLDWIGTHYVLVAGAGVDPNRWRQAAKEASRRMPVDFRALAATDPTGIYADDALCLIRPDGVIADHWLDREVGGEAGERLAKLLPTAAS